MRYLSAQRLLAVCLRSRVCAAGAGLAAGAALALPLVMGESPVYGAEERPDEAIPSVRLASLAAPETSSSTHDESAAFEIATAVASTPELELESEVTVSSAPTFNGRPIRAARTIRMRVTAYSPDARSCGDQADGITASGYSVLTNGGKLVAADTSLLPFGSMLSIPGYDLDAVVPVLDRGGAIKGHRLDVLFPTHEEARRWGVRDLDVTVWEYADGQPNGFREYHWAWKRSR